MDTHSVRAFLEPSHLEWGAEVAAFASRSLLPRPSAESDEAARTEARTLLGLMGEAGLFDPIGRRDLRACCVTREAVAAASPLADAVWALQGLGITPLLLAADDTLREAWAPRALRGEVMSAFAITEREAGSDVASLKTRAVRDGDSYVLDGSKWFISNAGIADYYIVFASTDPENRHVCSSRGT